MTQCSLFHKVTSVSLICAVSVITVIGSYPVHALPGLHMRRDMPSQRHLQTIVGPMLLTMLRRNLSTENHLNLSEDQYHRIDTEFRQFQQRADDIRQEFQVYTWSTRTQRAQHCQRPPDSTHETRQYMARLRFRELYIRHLTAIFDILTPEQREKLRHRGLTMLMMYTLGTAFRKMASAPRTENVRTVQSAHIDRSLEHRLLPECISGNFVYRYYLSLLPILSLEHRDILRM